MRHHNREQFRKDIERRLKILLLTKDYVVCAASHLTSEFAYNMFRENPILLHNSLVIPALREDIIDIGDLLKKKRLPVSLKQDMISFYKDEIVTTVDWKLEENSAWFRDSFLRELKNEKSVLRKNLAALPAEKLAPMISEIESKPLLIRESINSVASELEPWARKVLLDFRELVYHISGARVVNCESTLPQENYIDYSLADIDHRETMLSETQIFWKIFLEIAFETMHKKAVPLELFDLLSFKDIYHLRQPIDKSSFKNNYDRLIKKAIESVEKDPRESILYDIQELLTIRDIIVKDFEAVFEKELGPFLRRKTMGTFKELGKTGVSIGLGILGFFVPIIPGAISLLSRSPAMYINLNRVFRSTKSLNNYENYLRYKEATLRDSILKSEISEKTEMLDVVSLLVKTVSGRMKP
ncbi:MAG: hypothetical protein JRN22_00720 [Nitrososphaerota archaeon]|nr:hypothetical protein [Nitrososphaerota archaeon]